MIQLFGFLGALLSFLGAIVILSTDIARLVSILSKCLGFRCLQRLQQGRTQLVETGEIEEGDEGFDQVKTAVKHGRSISREPSRIKMETGVIIGEEDPAKVWLRGRNHPRKIGKSSTVIQWIWEYQERVLQKRGFIFLAVGFFFEVIYYGVQWLSI